MLDDTNWDHVLPSDLLPDILLTRFMNVCKGIIASTVPTILDPPFRARPLPKHIRRIYLAKRRMWARFRLSHNLVHHLQFCHLRSRLRSHIRSFRARREDVLASSPNRNLFYQTIKKSLRIPALPCLFV